MKHGSQVVVKRIDQLDPTLRNYVREANQKQFGDVPIVREHTWAEPEWTMVLLLDEKPISFLNVMKRTGKIDNEQLKIAGINNVMTLAEYRGGGYSSTLMRELEPFIFQKLGVDIGLLLCATDLVPYYEKFGWKRMDCPLVFQQPNRGNVTWGAETMILNRDHSQPTANLIDLCGLPW